MEPTYNEYGQIINLKYYGLGLQEIIKLSFPSDIQGSSEYSTFSFISQTPSDLAGKYVEIYDQTGKVVPWFNLDSGNSQPVVSGSPRYIEISIATGDSSNTLASKFSTTIHSDSNFNAAVNNSLAIIQCVAKGIRTNSTIGNTTLLLSITKGVDTLAGKLFYLWTYDNTSKYAFYYTIDGSGTPPSYTGLSLTVIPILGTDTIEQISLKTASIINNNVYFTATSSLGVTTVSYRPAGNTNGYLDIDSRLNCNTVQFGTDMELVQEIIITYDAICGKVSKIQALL